MADNQSFSIQGFNLVTLLKRLEAATSRLEDVTVFQESHVLANKDNAPAAVDAPAPAPVAAPAPADIPKSIKEFDLFIKENVIPYVELSKQIEPILGEQAEIFLKAIEKEREVLLIANKSKKINIEDLKFEKLIIKPINELIMKVIKIKDDNRSNKNFNYLNAVSEGVAVLGWIVVSTPISYIPDFKDSAQFWTNRILKDIKGKENEEISIEWVKKFLNIFDELKNYVKEFQTTGISWNGSEDFEECITKLEAGGASGGAPAPPPPPANLFEDIKESKNDNKNKTGNNGGSMSAVFAELSKGESITSGLKKVDKSEMTHKNPELRKKPVPLPPKKPKSLSTKEEEIKAVAKVKKAPQHELVDNKWMITNVSKEDIENGMISIDGSMNESVYIGHCEGVVVEIKGKVNAISVNMCERVGVVVARAIASVELTQCKRCEVQVVESVPVVSVDQSDSTGVYLSESSLGVELYSSGCTALNVYVPARDDAGDLREASVCEQFVTRIDAQTRAVTTAAVSHA